MSLEDEARGILCDFDALTRFRFMRNYTNYIAGNGNSTEDAGAAATATQATSEPFCNIDRAYALQRTVKALRVDCGEKTIGFKVGCTSAKIREALGIAESVHGYLWEGEQLDTGAQLHASRYRRLGIEGELGIWLLTTEGPVATWLVEYEPIIELHHFCFDGPPEQRAFELIARNAIHCGVVHANARKRCRLGDVPLDVPIVVTIDDEVVESPVLSQLELEGLLGPLATVTWLHERLQDEGNDEELKAGDFVLTATPGNVIPLDAGSRLDVEFMGLHARCTVFTDS
eukprot:TRINITY_DN63371_c0_g1_i1.p1 TRINITY_DN63371_c0_g1~~TRINITY_DN63371_c0_g1_i1.p1  ORF type:complete len:286 (-),score=27.20 TRINITY_DN63371_c0_g1_i1:77-934(-)